MQQPHDLSPDERAVARLLDATVHRLRTADALRGLAAGLLAGALCVLAGRFTETQVAFGAACAAFVCALLVFWLLRPQRNRRVAAERIEAAHSHLRNVIFSAQQLLADPDRTPPYMRSRVFAQASAAGPSISVQRSVSLRSPLLISLAAAACLAVVSVVPVARRDHKRTADSAPRSNDSLTVGPGDLLIEITPPSYARLPSVRLRNPATIEALAGSRAVMTMAASSPERVRLNGADLVVSPFGGMLKAETLLTESGYVAIDGSARDTNRRLIPLTVTPDRAPDVRVTSPAKDVRVPDASLTIPLEATAVDDLGLAALEIRYTKISGAGEQFEFKEGTLPVALSRASATEWHARAQLALAALKMAPGDALVYRAVARDRQPGERSTSSSDTYFVEIAGPGAIALTGFEMPPDRERYLLSQAMIVLHIERLQAREKTMSRQAVQEAASSIAAEQRAVRANFIFLLGGEIEDEEQEAETSTEIAEGRFENSARREITLATRLMTRAEQALSAASTAAALPPARAAARALQRAFGHNRYLLRALPARTRVDPSRRLSGDVTSAADWLRDLTPSTPDPTVAAAREVLRSQLAVSRSLHDRSQWRSAEDALARLAERVLTIAPGEQAMQHAAHEMTASREALVRSDVEAARAALQRAVSPVLAVAQRGRIDTDVNRRPADRVAGALSVGATR